MISVYTLLMYDTLGTISRRMYPQPTTNPNRKLTTTETADPMSRVLANLVTFGYVSYRIVYSKLKQKKKMNLRINERIEFRSATLVISTTQCVKYPENPDANPTCIRDRN